MVSSRYSTEEELLDDLRLMFNNCRQYNEEGSVIYEDANTLERVLLDKARDLGIASVKQKKYDSLFREWISLLFQ